MKMMTTKAYAVNYLHTPRMFSYLLRFRALPTNSHLFKSNFYNQMPVEHAYRYLVSRMERVQHSFNVHLKFLMNKTTVIRE